MIIVLERARAPGMDEFGSADDRMYVKLGSRYDKHTS
jgi:hypothetical protein